MRAGSLRDRVTFQRASRMSDGQGGGRRQWLPLFTVWGALREERGTERLEQGRIAAPFGATLRVRVSTDTAGITTADRAEIGGILYDIRAIAQPDRRNRAFEMTLERGVAT